MIKGTAVFWYNDIVFFAQHHTTWIYLAPTTSDFAGEEQDLLRIPLDFRGESEHLESQ